MNHSLFMISLKPRAMSVSCVIGSESMFSTLMKCVYPSSVCATTVSAMILSFIGFV